MTAELLQAFEKLPAEERKEFVKEVLRRVQPARHLQARGIDEAHAADLRARLKTFAEDWNRPEAAIYDEDPARGSTEAHIGALSPASGPRSQNVPAAAASSSSSPEHHKPRVARTV